MLCNTHREECLICSKINRACGLDFVLIRAHVAFALFVRMFCNTDSPVISSLNMWWKEMFNSGAIKPTHEPKETFHTVNRNYRRKPKKACAHTHRHIMRAHKEKRCSHTAERRLWKCWKSKTHPCIMNNWSKHKEQGRRIEMSNAMHAH